MNIIVVASAASFAAFLGVIFQPSATAQVKVDGPRPRFTPGPARPVRQQVIDFDMIPASMIRFDKPAGWSVRRSPDVGPNAIPPAMPGVYAEYRGFTMPGHECREYPLAAVIDLRPIRANGFRLVSATLSGVPVPNGFASEMGGYWRDTNGPPAEVLEYRVVTPIYAKTITSDKRLPRQCWAGFHVRFKLIGPAGINPLSGQPYAPHRPVN